MSDDIALSTYAVFAICVLLVLAIAFGTFGIPVKSGESIFDFVFTKLCSELILLSSVINLVFIVEKLLCNVDNLFP